MTKPAKNNICLSLSHQQNPQGLKYQLLSIELTSEDRIISPEELADLELPSGINTTIGVIISGRAPIWLYNYLVHELHPTAWIASYEPRLHCAIVVATHSHLVKIAQRISLEQQQDSPLCTGLMIVGPPNSGKSVLSHALFTALLPQFSNIYLQRANWDGEGNYVLELTPEANGDGETFKAANKGSLTPEFFPFQAEAILQLRRQKSLVIVDVGGMVQPEKQPILEACSHYLIISSSPEEVESWHNFCRDRANLKPVAVIHSSLTECEIIHQEQPYLEMTCGPWIAGQPRPIPQTLIAAVQKLVKI
ncbi:CRISPR-associated protein Csx3 [[Phormidium ambiguum] IAM M-71]|uniref:CRISPR-associated protein Csx3 n=1 Tax=[Phormidium ambiguum] IAM M-71 TaxID=454136 RepID=A0A1U7IFD8_9CYAN|nr:CRISPR-associated ring nuclease Crn3/Csx3 [Phormidium ambiguum]OKH35748.1 CRISPR-associated protein Csx3 [Phormidium ambiguum IAM M-71]